MIGSLFSGIGGLELGLELAGFGPTAWQVEIDPFCRSVLAKHFPGANRSICDVRLGNASTLAPVDLICGGFPCQDVSGAGAGAGLSGARSGLWYDFLRIVRELRPSLIVVENVRSGAKKYLCEVRSGLHASGYRTRALEIGADDVGATHKRRRVFTIARVVPDGSSQRREGADVNESQESGAGGFALVPDPRSDYSETTLPESGLGRGVYGFPGCLDGLTRWPARANEQQHAWEPPRAIRRVDAAPNRRARLKALGNSVVPQCAFVAGLVLKAWIEEVCPPLP